MERFYCFDWSCQRVYFNGSSKNVQPAMDLGMKNNRVFQLWTFEHALEFLEESVGFYKLNASDIQGIEVLAGFAIWGLGMIIHHKPF